MFDDLDTSTIVLIAASFAIGYWLVSAAMAKLNPKSANPTEPEVLPPPPRTASAPTDPPLRAPFRGSIRETSLNDPDQPPGR
jgi:hypothetical protein